MIPLGKIFRCTREEDGVFGKVVLNGKAICESLENEEYMVHEGLYRCKKDNTGRFRWWRLEDRFGRTYIEIHDGANENNSLGCVLFGTGIEISRGKKKGIFGGEEALQRFSSALGDNDVFDLQIINLF